MSAAPLLLSRSTGRLSRFVAPIKPGSFRYCAPPASRGLQIKLASASSAAAPMPGDSSESKKDDVSGPMLEPSVVNTPWARTAITAAAIATAAGSSALLPVKAALFAHITSWGALFGCGLWQTFFVGLIMFRVVPRQTFGRIQAKLFPKYFALSTGTTAFLLASLPLLPSAPSSVSTWLYACLAGHAINWLLIEPLTTKIMFQRYDIENKEQKTEEDQASIKKLYKQFGKWHGISSLLNMVAFAASVAHGWWLSSVIAV